MSTSTSAGWHAELALLNALFDLPPPEREARLADVERSDPDLAQTVRRMLLASDAVAAEGADIEASAVAVGALLGERFRVLRSLGRGGMGEVFLACRDDGIDHHVAIKILHGEGLPLTRARARHEQQILAKLAHPNIAKLIDAGLTDAGRPWFAMEYVDGERLLDWCDHRMLDVAERVRLFVPVARALQFAHRSLILHRDVKPSNILVDRDGRPVLVDFGIAKVLDAQGPAHETRTLALTPAYAAPEQLRGESATTATEVYQLGIVLYELATGISARASRPVAAVDGPDALPRPHQAFAEHWLRDRAAAERVVRARASTPEKLRRVLKGDLGRIVEKATRPLPGERYDTAQAFADDLERWLAGVPVSAHRGTWSYRFGKLVRRHKAASALVAVLLLGLLATSGLALNRAQREHEQRIAAERQRERSDSLLDFFRSVFQQTDPAHSMGAAKAVRADELLQRAGAALARRSDVDPVTRAALLREIALAFQHLDRPDLGVDPAEQALALLTPQDLAHRRDYLASVDAAAAVYHDLDRYQDTIALLQRTQPLLPAVAGGEPDWRTTFAIRRSWAEIGLGRLDAAEADIRAALDDLDRRGALDGSAGLDARTVLSMVLTTQGKIHEAIAVQRAILAAVARDGAVESPGLIGASSLMTVRVLLGSNLRAAGEVREAATQFEAALAADEAVFGPRSSSMIGLKQQLLGAYLDTGRPWQARPLSEELSAQPADDGDREAQARVAIAMVRYRIAAGRFSEAAEQARRLLDAPAAQPMTPTANTYLRLLLGEAQLQGGEAGQALASFEQALRDDPFPQERSVYRALIEDGIGRAHLARREFSPAIEHLRTATDRFGRLLGADKPAALRSAIHLQWAQTLAARDWAQLQRLDAQRDALVNALGGEDRLQVWQFDRMRDRLARDLGRPGVERAVLERADEGLRQVAGAGEAPAYFGLGQM